MALLPARAVARRTCGGGASRACKFVVAPSLTPDSYNLWEKYGDDIRVVAPSLTPDSYNQAAVRRRYPVVVAPSLTPDSYNLSLMFIATV